MTSPVSLFNAAILMLVLVMLSVCLFISVGLCGDIMKNRFESTTDMLDVPKEWESTGMINSMYSLFMFSMSLPGILGILIFLVTASKRQRIDTYTDFYESAQSTPSYASDEMVGRQL